jgi:nucleoside-diphosphate-sugar epimerase
MEDAIRATIDLMHADASRLTIRSSYNISGCSFTPRELSTIIKESLPDFVIKYEPDYRQAIADSWPQSINDQTAQNDWDWKPKYNTAKLTEDMLIHIREMLAEKA